MVEAVAPYVAKGVNWLLAGAGSSVTVTASSFAVQAITYVGLTAVTLAANNALAGKPDFTALDTSQGRLLNAREAAAPQQYVYGKVRKGGTIVSMQVDGSNNQYLHLIIAVAGHEVNSISDVYINDEVVSIDSNGFVNAAPWNGKVIVKKYDGTQTQKPNGSYPYLETDIGSGIAYLYVRLQYDQNVFANGIPVFTAVVEGKKVYDPRDSGQSATDSSTWTYSANSALCVADYIRSAYGLGDSSYSRIDDTMLQVAANVCDENVNLSGGGTEKRYECHGVLSASNTPANNISKMLTSCAGTLFWGAGKWKIKAGSYTSPVKDLSEDDLRSDISLKTRSSSRDNFNAVQGTFIDATQDWITVDYPQIKSTGTFLFEDGGVENILDLELPFTTSSSMAQRLAKQTLYRNRKQMALSAEFGLSAFDLQVGDIIRLSIDRYGWSNKEFEVLSWSLSPSSDGGDMRVALSLQETAQASYSWSAEEASISTGQTTLPRYNDPVKFNFTPSFEVNAFSEKFEKDLVITITSSNIERISHFEVQVARATDKYGILDVNGIIDKQKVMRALQAGNSDFKLYGGWGTETRDIGDLNNDGSVNRTDGDIYRAYYFRLGDLDNDQDEDATDEAIAERIGMLHRVMLFDEETYRSRFSEYLLSVTTPLSNYETIWQGPAPVAKINNISNGRWNIRVRASSILGFRSDWVYYKNFEIPFSDKDIGAPKDGFASPSGIQALELYWKPAGSPSLSHYEVRHSDLVHGEEVTTGNFIAGHHYEITVVGDTDFTEIGAASNTVGVQFWCHSDGSTYSYDAVGGGTTGKAKNVVKIDKTISWVDNVSAPANSVMTSPKVGTYVVRSFSKASTPSEEYIRIPVTANEFDNPFSSSSTTNEWEFDGDYSQITVTSSNPYYPTGAYFLIDEEDFPSVQTLTAVNTIDIGSVQEARVTLEADFIRLNVDNKVSETIDQVNGDIDNLAVPFDDLQYEIVGNFDMILYVKVSNNNTTFSEWQRVTSNIVKGRYFQFKVEIACQENAGPVFRGVTSYSNPSSGVSRATLDHLVAKVEY